MPVSCTPSHTKNKSKMIFKVMVVFEAGGKIRGVKIWILAVAIYVETQFFCRQNPDSFSYNNKDVTRTHLHNIICSAGGWLT